MQVHPKNAYCLVHAVLQYYNLKSLRINSPSEYVKLNRDNEKSKQPVHLLDFAAATYRDDCSGRCPGRPGPPRSGNVVRLWQPLNLGQKTNPRGGGNEVEDVSTIVHAQINGKDYARCRVEHPAFRAIFNAAGVDLPERYADTVHVRIEREFQESRNEIKQDLAQSCESIAPSPDDRC